MHIFLFLWIAISMIIFTLYPDLLNSFGHIFWVQRWADVLVYMSILFLLYFVLFLFNKSEKNRRDLTDFVREQALSAHDFENLKIECLILIRSYNEWKVLKQTIESVLDAWYEKILLVDDGSTDNTWEIVKSFQNKIIYLKHLKNRWAWSALETGFEFVRRFVDCKYLVNFDADGQHDIADLPKFIEKFENNEKLQVAIGSRFVEKTQSNVPFTRKIILFLWKYFTFFISWIFLTDAHNGYRVFSKQAVNQIHLTIDGMAYASELVDKINKKKLEFIEVPVNIKYTEYSMSKWQKNSNAIKIALSMINKKFFE